MVLPGAYYSGSALVRACRRHRRRHLRRRGWCLRKESSVSRQHGSAVCRPAKSSGCSPEVLAVCSLALQRIVSACDMFFVVIEAQSCSAACLVLPASHCHCSIVPMAATAATTSPQTIRIGEQINDYTYQCAPQFVLRHCLAFTTSLPSANASLKPRLREDSEGKTIYTCCRPAKGYNVPEGNVLHLIFVNHQWLAIHADPAATFADIEQQDIALMAFSTEENILIDGSHTWAVLSLFVNTLSSLVPL